MKSIKNILIAAIILSLSGCISHTDLVNYQDVPLIDNEGNIVHGMDSLLAPRANIRIGPNDVLDIKVFSLDVETAAPFNVVPNTEGSNINNSETVQLNGYLVDNIGTIDFPVLGTIEVKGLTISEIKEKFKTLLNQYINDPVVNVRLINFSITVTGEVKNQGVFTIFNERVTLPDALALAGGLTDYANRNNLLIVREENGVRTLNRISLLTSNFFYSKYYYLKQNDMVYVEPIKAKTGAVQDQTSKNIPVIGTAATLIALIIGIFR